jgi:peptidoglycan/LPS O-acetylase OafA/YrhL
LHQTPDIHDLKKDNPYLIQLDGLRFFAILSVMIAHWLQWQTEKPLYKAFPFVEGVTLFFVISGYLITDILLRNKIHYEEIKQQKTPLIKAFYIRRVLRIFPVYFITLLFLYAISYKNIKEVFPWLSTFTSNIYMPLKQAYMGNLNHFWSLAVEEQFYLFWPWLLIFIPTKHTGKLIVIIIALSVLSKFLLIKYTGNWMACSYYTFCCVNTLGLGALFAYWNIFKKNRISFFLNPYWIVISMSLYFIIHYAASLKNWDIEKNSTDTFLYAVMAVMLVNYAVNNKFAGIFKQILENRFVVYSGKISYGLYIFHLFIPDFIKEFLCPKIGIEINNKYVLFVIYYAVAFIIAHISWKLIESPINNLKKHFPYLRVQK